MAVVLRQWYHREQPYRYQGPDDDDGHGIIRPLFLMPAVSYLGNRYWTFRYRQRTSVSREGILYFAVNGAGLVIQLSCLGFTAYVLGLNGGLSDNIVLVIGSGLSTLFRYWSCKKWVWRAQPPAPPAPARRETVFC
ncbi:MAG: GtrA family protein [Streptosporangiaceae bacterium]|jgi:hypothetical protein